jgi:hypothetical protein
MNPNGPRVSPSAPATRSRSTQESTSKDHTKSTHPTKVNNLEEGKALLEEKGYLIAGEQIRLEQISIVLFQLARAIPHTQKTAADSLRALAYIMDQVATEAAATSIVEAVLAKLTIPIEQIQKAAELAASVPLDTTQPGTSQTYARAASRMIPPKHAEAITRGDMLERRFLVGGKDDRSLADLSEKELVSKANTTLAIMESAALGSPEGIRFVGVDVLRSGTVAYHLNNIEAARWIQKEENAKAFMSHFGGASLAKPLLIHTLVEFVPLTFDPNLLSAVEAVERNSGLPSRSLLFAKFIKQKERRHSGQTLGHAIFGFSTRETANHAMVHGLYVEGKRVLARKLLPDPRRCTKCQAVGVSHLAADCKFERDVCGRCSENHWTSKCPVSDPKLLKCHNCRDKETWPHTTADRRCPTFVAAVQKLHARTPDSRYRYFVTNDPATWELMPGKENNDLYSNIQDAMWQNGEDWRGGWTAARQSKAGRGFGRLAGGQWGEGGAPGGFTMGDVATNEQRTTGLARKEQTGKAKAAASGMSGASLPEMGTASGAAQESTAVARGKPGTGRGAGFRIGGVGRGANRNAQDTGWRGTKTQGTLDGFISESRPPSQMSQRVGSAIPWGDRPDGPDGLPPLPPTSSAQSNTTPLQPATMTANATSSVTNVS